MTAPPAWTELCENDQAAVVAFIRTAEDEGVDYAWENYPPEFDMQSPLWDILDGHTLRQQYCPDVEALAIAEFWRLYKLGVG